MAKKTIDVLEATDDAINAVAFFRQYGTQLRTGLFAPSGNPPHQGLRPPIVAALLQPISSGEEGLAMILQKQTVLNSFRMDMFGYFNQVTDFKFSIQIQQYPYLNGVIVGGNPITIATTSLITAKTATDKVVLDALLATGKFAPNEISVTLGNLYQSEDLVNNEALRWSLFGQTPTVNPTTRKEDMFSYVGQWFITFSGRWENYALYPAALDSGGHAFNDTFGQQFQAVVSQRSRLVPSGVVEYVVDVGNTPVTGPLVGGTQVLCIDVPGIGYAIASAFPREFFE